jgi:hypothetical protein
MTLVKNNVKIVGSGTHSGIHSSRLSRPWLTPESRQPRLQVEQIVRARRVLGMSGKWLLVGSGVI